MINAGMSLFDASALRQLVHHQATMLKPHHLLQSGSMST